jgi:predicted RNA methylase
MDGRRIEWTGERCVPWTDDLQVVYEHYHRYALAARFTNGARVLDLACGEGYGAALLAAGARDVVAVDIRPAHRGARHLELPRRQPVFHDRVDDRS